MPSIQRHYSTSSRAGESAIVDDATIGKVNDILASDPLYGTTPAPFCQSMSSGRYEWEIYGNGLNQKMVNLSDLVPDYNHKPIGQIAMACDSYVTGMRECPPTTYNWETVMDRSNLYHATLESFIQEMKPMYVFAGQEGIAQGLLKMRAFGRSTDPDVDHQVNGLVLFTHTAIAVKMSSYNTETAIEFYDPCVSNVIFKVKVQIGDLHATRINQDVRPYSFDLSDWRSEADAIISEAIKDFVMNGPIFEKHIKAGEVCAILTGGSLLQPLANSSKRIFRFYEEAVPNGLLSEQGDPVELAIWAMRMADLDLVRDCLTTLHDGDIGFNNSTQIDELIDKTVEELSGARNTELRKELVGILREGLPAPRTGNASAVAKLKQFGARLEMGVGNPIRHQAQESRTEAGSHSDYDPSRGNPTENHSVSSPDKRSRRRKQSSRQIHRTHEYTEVKPSNGTNLSRGLAHTQVVDASKAEIKANFGLSQRELMIVAGGVGVASSVFMLSTHGISASTLVAVGAMVFVVANLLQVANQGNR